MPCPFHKIHDPCEIDRVNERERIKSGDEVMREKGDDLMTESG